MSFIPSIARHVASASHDISSSSSGDEESGSQSESEVHDVNAAAAAAAEAEKIEEETQKIKKTLKRSKPIYEDYLMPGSGRASSESGSEPDRKRKAKRRSDSPESESESDRLRREIREEVQRELRAALNVKAEKVKQQKKPEGGKEARASGSDNRDESGGSKTKSLSEKAITYKVEKPKQAKGGGGLSYKYQKQLATCVRQLVQLGDKINAIAQSADKRN